MKNMNKDSFNNKLKSMFPSLQRDYLEHGNMVDLEDFLKQAYTQIGGDDINLIKIINDLEVGGVSKKDIKVGVMVDDTWGWRL